MRKRTVPSLYFQFTTFSVMNLPLGTMMAMLSLVTTTVLRAPISMTSPSTSSTTMRSPILIGRSNMMIRPLMKLLMTFCRPNPTPMPMAPASTLSVVRSMPTVCTITSRPVSSTT